jgi:hypothetical protein
MNDTQFPRLVVETAIDWWIAVLLLLTPLCAITIGTYLLIARQSSDAGVVFLVGAVSIFAILPFTYPCRYTLLSDTLNIRCGLICYSIPLDKIERAESSSSWRSAPAMSLKRIAILSGGRTYLISPRDRDSFLSELHRRMVASKAVALNE